MVQYTSNPSTLILNLEVSVKKKTDLVRELNQRAEKAVTYADWESIYTSSPAGSMPEFSARQGMCKTAQTFAEWENIFRSCSNGPRIEAIAIKEMVKLAQTFQEWATIFDMSQCGSITAFQSLEKMVGLAQTVDEWRNVLLCAPINSELKSRARDEVARLKSLGGIDG
jgi:hypothetical protein